jgi:hypothetical protein
MPPLPKAHSPNFFIVGAPKAGTTSLYYYLDQHPEIFMSPLKEPSYFSSEVRSENFEPALQPQARRDEQSTRQYLAGPLDQKRFSGIVRDWNDYLRLFASSNGHKAIGEASVCYLWSETAATAIASRLPNARIVIVLRDPSDRAFSQYLHNISDGLVSHSFRSHVYASLQRKEKTFGVLYPLLEVGLYTAQVQRYLDTFPRGQIGIWLYEDTKRPTFLPDVLRFLQVDPTITLDTSTRHLEPQLPRLTGMSQTLRRRGLWTTLKHLTPTPLKPIARTLAYRKTGSVKISAEDRAFLIDYYKEDIVKLANLLNRDLSPWLH